ncbi:MAG: DUF2905 domain-containing protein [Nitriliruptoraceae bacterium]
MDPRSLGWMVAIVGAILVVVGVLLASGALSWFGRLPGDLRWSGERTTVFVPITSMLVLSAIVSLLLWLVRR